MISRIIYLFFWSLLICCRINAQSKDADVQKFMIFTFEVANKEFKVRQYYWITPIDSIEKRNAFEVFPLYLEEYSKDLLERCKVSKDIDVFSASTQTNFNFDDEYNQSIKNLLSLISLNRIKVQTLNKNWQGKEKSKETVKVYATPIIGKFCYCLQTHIKATFGFKGLAYLPVASFSYDGNFWNSKDGKIVKYVDYSYVAFSSHYPSIIHGNSNIRVKSSIEVF